MSVIPAQRFRFLGGEVSPNMYHSADMDKYGRWFSKAENIRFDTLGAFRNRTGFEKIANTKVVNGVKIKLLSFTFSRDESYLIEMGPGYFRFFEDGVPVYKNGDPTQGVYELPHDMNVIDADIKYAQAGDVLYLVNGMNPVCTLTRNDVSGYNWTFDKFKFVDSCPPLDETNTDETKTLAISNTTVTAKTYYYDFVTDLPFFAAKNVTIRLTDDNDVTHDYSTVSDTFYTGSELATYFNGTDLHDVYDLDFAFDPNSNRLNVIDSLASTSGIKSISFLTCTYLSSKRTMSAMGSDLHGTYFVLADENEAGFDSSTGYLYAINAKIYIQSGHIMQIFNKTTDVIGSFDAWKNTYTLSTQVANLKAAATDWPSSREFNLEDTETANYKKLTVIYNPTVQEAHATNYELSLALVSTVTDTELLSISGSSNASLFDITSTGHNFFADKQAGDVFGINYKIDAGSVSYNADDAGNSAVDATSDIITTNGAIGFSTSGNWEGEFVVEYSLDGSTNWKVFRTVVSRNKKTPNNVNIAGKITDEADVVYVRLRVTSALTKDTYPLVAYFISDMFNVNSYYRIIAKNSNTDAVCECVKNNFAIPSGTTKTVYEWKESVFSQSEGYPTTVGLYQNRLIFGKEYMLWASKTNEFNDFYEPSQLTASDPVSMSLLANKYHSIRNILTLRKFFVFSDDGEFGIASQAALSQTDKALLPISYHGSAPCSPILAGNLALFVDISGHVVRLFQYSYETDAFEANDASVFLEQLLEGRTILTTDYLKNSKEALFLDNLGTIWVFKLMPEQEIFAWSHWEYAKAGKITNMRVVVNGPDEDLYIAVEDDDLGEKRIEKLSKESFVDSEKVYTSLSNQKRWYTDFNEDTVLIVDANNQRFKVIVGPSGLVELPIYTKEIVCHYSYTATATLLSPVERLTEESYTTYNKARPFKVHFCYQNSFGFQAGIEEGEKMLIRFNSGDRPESTELTSGKREVLIPARYDGSCRVSFVQERPYNMSINNIMIDMDYGGK